MSYFIYADLISSLLNRKLVDPGSNLIILVHTILNVVFADLRPEAKNKSNCCWRRRWRWRVRFYQ